MLNKMNSSTSLEKMSNIIVPKKVAILQSNYIPWKGYFDLIATVDEFIIYDDMQYTKNDWRNRNKIKTPNGLEWLTVPVGQDIRRKIKEVKIQGAIWQAKHWRSIEANYRRAEYFDEISSWLKPIYFEPYENLSVLNRRLIESVCNFFKIKTLISNSWNYILKDGKTERLVDLCIQANATEYISGPAAKNYLDESIFNSNSLKLSWFDYAGYPEYPQLWGEFSHNVTILDLLFNCGPFAPNYMRYIRS